MTQHAVLALAPLLLTASAAPDTLDAAASALAAPLFVPAADDARVLEPGAGLEARGYDREYFEKLARPRLSDEALDRAAAHDDGRRVMSVPSVNGGFQKATLLDGNILVVEGSGGAAVTEGGETTFVHGNVGISTVINQVWSALGDDYDFISVFSTFNDDSVAAYYLPLQNDIVGLGDCNWNAGATFGCTFNSFSGNTRLQGFVFMNSLETWQYYDYNFDGVVHPYTSKDSSIYSTLGQEIAHRWLAALRFADPLTGVPSQKLLGRDGSHWAGYVDTDASVMDGWDWIEDEQGFKALAAMDSYWSVDLYAMGALAPAEVPPFFYIENARFVPNGYIGNQPVPGAAASYLPNPALFAESNIDVRATGTRVDLGVSDIVAAEGMRCPSTEDAPRAFKQLFVLVTRPGETKSQVESLIDKLEQVRVLWEEFFFEHTRGRLRICTDVGAECTTATPMLGRAKLGDGVVEPGTAPVLDVRMHVFDAPVDDASLVLALDGEGAAFASLASSEKVVGGLAVNDQWDERTEIVLADDYPCGAPLVVDARFVSAGNADVVERYTFRPGTEPAARFDFDDDVEGFVVEGEGPARFRRDYITASCEMSPFAPSDDATPTRGGAFLTGEGAGAIDEQVLTSPPIDARPGAQLAVAVWVAGDAALRVEALGPGAAPVVLAAVESAAVPSWQRLLLPLDEALGADGGAVTLRFVATGGEGEVGIDDVEVLDLAGRCAPAPLTPGDDPGDDLPVNPLFVDGGCGSCASSVPGVDPALAFAVIALGVVARRRRR